MNKRNVNPDDCSANVEKLHELVHDTLENIDKAEERMEWVPVKIKKKET